MEGDRPINVEDLIKILISSSRSSYLGCRPELITAAHIVEAGESGDIVLGHILNPAANLSELVPLRGEHELDKFKNRVKDDEEAECTFFRLRGGWEKYGNNYADRLPNSRGGLFAPVTSIHHHALA